jgi:hypothetical protein
LLAATALEQPSMSAARPRIAIVFPANPDQMAATPLAGSRFAATADALTGAGADVIGAPYVDAIADEVRERLAAVDAVLVWLNPIEAGRDRRVLNSVLREVASTGVLVSAHPDVIDRMGTKEVLFRTRDMAWGCDTRFHPSADTMLADLPKSLEPRNPRVLKQMRGHSGDGIWRLEMPSGTTGPTSPATPLRVRHAKRGSVEQEMTLGGFVDLCAPYFAAGGMIEQPFQTRLADGMIRCYVVGDKVAGFGEQLVNALHPQLEPGPRLYFPPTRPDFQRLKDLLEATWIAELCERVGLARADLPVLWDADFLYGPKDADGYDTFVLCEINVSSVYPYPPDALQPLVEATLDRIRERRNVA